MKFLYPFLFVIFFTFSSDQLQIKWTGLTVDLSLSGMMTEMFNGANLDRAESFLKDAFLLFKLPSGKSKNRKYILKLFDQNFNTVSPKTKLLVNLFVDRQALGFQEEYLNPLLHECITRGFCKSTLPVYLEKLKFFKEIRFSCFEYVKKNMVTDTSLLPNFFLSIVESERSIRSSPEWNELIDGKDGEFFLDGLVQADCNYLYLDRLSSKALTSFFQKIKKLKKRYKRITVLNSQMDLTLFELRMICRNSKLALKNCPNLKLGNDDQEIGEMIPWHIMRASYHPDFIFQNCSLDSESLKKCKEYGHKKSVIKILSLMISLYFGFLMSFSCASELLGDKYFSLFADALWCSCTGVFLLANRIKHFEYWRFLIVIRIVNLIIPVLLKDCFVFGYRLSSAAYMLGMFCIGFSNQYSQARKGMCRLKNPFGIITEYGVLDKLCKLFFWI